MESEEGHDERGNHNPSATEGGLGGAAEGGRSNATDSNEEQTEEGIQSETSPDNVVDTNSSSNGANNDQTVLQDHEDDLMLIEKGQLTDMFSTVPPVQQSPKTKKTIDDEGVYQEMANMAVANKERILAYTISSSDSPITSSRATEGAMLANDSNNPRTTTDIHGGGGGGDDDDGVMTTATRRSMSDSSEAVADRQVQAVQRRSILMTPGAYAIDPEGLNMEDSNDNTIEDAAAAAASVNNLNGSEQQPMTTATRDLLEDASASNTMADSDDPEAQGMAIEGAVLVVESEEDDDPVDVEDPRRHGPSRDDEGELVHGTVLPDTGGPPTPPKRSPTQQLMGMAAIVILLLILILVPVLVFRGNDNDRNSNGINSSNNGNGKEPILYPPFQEELNQETILAIQDPSNAYYHANAWMLNDPNFDQYSPERRYQRFSMAWMYYIWGGKDWYHNDHWLSYDVHECHWYMQNSSYGIDGWHVDDDPSTLQSICNEEGQLRVLNLTNNNLNGYLPASQTVNFPELVIIDLANNNISGFVPSVGEDTKKMIVFSVANNNLAGQLTGGGGFNTFDLRIIRLEGNSLLGYLAGIYWVLPDLQLLDSTGNLFDGIIEPSASMCSNLTHWRIGQNLYEGTLPSEIGKMTALQELVVGGNERLTGTIPSQLGLLSNLNLLDVSQTALEGKIPEGLCNRVLEGALEVAANCSIIQCCDNMLS